MILNNTLIQGNSTRVLQRSLKDKSGVSAIVVGGMKDYTVVNGVQHFFPTLFSLFSAKFRISVFEMSEVM